MSHTSKKSKAAIAAAAVVIIGLLLFTGCKKKSESDVSAVPQAPTAAQIEQTTCPVMAGPVNKDFYTEYKGKKVYFCCAGCKEKFEQDPEKYIAKLPQFK